MFRIHGHPDDYFRATPSWWRETFDRTGFARLDLMPLVWGRGATRAVVTVEDHVAEGGIGDAVRSALAGGGVVRGFVAPGGAAFSRKQLDALTEQAGAGIRGARDDASSGSFVLLPHTIVSDWPR